MKGRGELGIKNFFKKFNKKNIFFIFFYTIKYEIKNVTKIININSTKKHYSYKYFFISLYL